MWILIYYGTMRSFYCGDNFGLYIHYTLNSLVTTLVLSVVRVVVLVVDMYIRIVTRLYRYELVMPVVDET